MGAEWEWESGSDFDDADVVASFEEGLEATMNETTVTVTGATDARRRRRLDDAPATTVLFEMLSRRSSADLAADLDAALATGVLAHRLRHQHRRVRRVLQSQRVVTEAQVWQEQHHACNSADEGEGTEKHIECVVGGISGPRPGSIAVISIAA